MTGRRLCAFCGNSGPLTREHVLGNWLSKIGLDSGPVENVAGPLNRIGKPMGVAPPFQMTVKNVGVNTGSADPDATYIIEVVPKERPIDFNYGYRMLCERCAVSNWLTADAYATLNLSGESICRSCNEKNSVGPKFIDLRDQGDEAVDKTKLHDLFWYHTTPERDWPSATYRWPEDERKSYQDTSSPEQFEQIDRFKGDQALHLGTYEAAIENMLRRMDQRDERHVQFNLYRVTLQETANFQNGFRNENHDEAEKITQSKLREQDLGGIRYLNAHESMGSISLAVVRETIESVQRISLPVEGLSDYLTPEVADDLVQLRKEVDRYEQEVCGQEPPSVAIRRFLSQRDSESRAPVSTVRTVATGTAKGVPTSPCEHAAKEYLKGVSPVVRQQFCRSVQRPRRAGEHVDDQAWLSVFMNLAPILTRPEKVLAALDEQTPIDVLPA